MNKYEIIGIVGEGAYGIVYKAKNKDSGEFVAIKKFKESAEEDYIVKKTTKREVKMLSVLKDKSVVRMIEAFKRKGKLYLVFEFMDRNLLEVLEEKPDGLDRDNVRYFIYQLLKAVDYFHSQNVMHRDIKPENLLISSKTNELKVCDFGFARHLSRKSEWNNIHSQSNKSSDGDAEEKNGTSSPELTDYVATRWYRSPELLLVSENLPYGKEVDIWAIGCIMGELMDGQPLFPGDSEVDQLFVIQKVLGPLPDFLQDEFNRNTRYQGLKFPEISHPETIEARYAPVMNDEEIDLMKKMLEMDPYQRISARQAIEHDYFDKLREKDPEYNGQGSSSSIDDQMRGNGSEANILNNKRILSPELINQRQKIGSQVNQKGQESGNFNISNKNSFSQASHNDAARRSDNNYRKDMPPGQNQANPMMKSNNSGGTFINLNGQDPLHHQKKSSQQQYSPSGQNNYYKKQGGNPKGIKNQNMDSHGDQDYNYDINMEKINSGSSGQQIHGNPNPLLASVHTQGSLKTNDLTQQNPPRRIVPNNKISGNSQGSHNGSAINISKMKDAIQQKQNDNLGAPGGVQSGQNQRVGSINSNPGSTASRGSKNNIHQQASNAIHQIQNSQSPPSVRNKIQMHKITKNSNQKGAQNLNQKKSQNQYTMYQSNHLPMTSQQSRRKSQVSINNMVNQQIDPLQAMNYQGMNMAMGLQINNMNNMQNMAMMQNNGNFMGGMSDTGAAPDNSSGSMINIGGGQMHPMQMYQSNFTGSSLAQYQAMNQGQFNGMMNMNNPQGINISHQLSSQEKKRSNKQSKNNVAMRFPGGYDFDQGTNMNIPLSSNAVLHHENWREDQQSNGLKPQSQPGGIQGSHYKVGSKMKLGAATSTNFMKNNIQNQNNQYNMSMLRSVQQNMPNMPNEYNYKIPAVSSQSKIMFQGSGQGNGTGGSQGMGAVYRGNTKKFVMNNANQMQMVAEINQRNMGGPNSISGNRQPRAATQGGHIFGGQMGRGGAYAHMGSKLNKVNQNQQKFANSNMHDNSLSNGYLMGNASHGSPKYNSKSKYFSNQPMMNMKFPTTSHGNRSSTNHNNHHTGNLQYSTNHGNMQNVLGNIQKHI